MDPITAGLLIGGPTVARGIFNLFDDSEEQHQRTMSDVARQYQQYRPEMQANRYQAMQNQAAAFGPMQQLMGQMYGPGAQMDFSKIVQNPFAHSALPQQPQHTPQKTYMRGQMGFDPYTAQPAKNDPRTQMGFNPENGDKIPSGAYDWSF